MHLKHIKKAEGSTQITGSFTNIGRGGSLEVFHKEATFTRRKMHC
jgi:hypothetical protein